MIEKQRQMGLHAVHKKSSSALTSRWKSLTSGSAPPDQVVMKKHHTMVLSREMLCLGDKQWLNDAVIDMYLNLLRDKFRSRYNSIHVFNTRFFPALLKTAKYVKKTVRNVSLLCP